MLASLIFKRLFIITFFIISFITYFKTELYPQSHTQLTILGRVTDFVTGEPIVNVNLYLANTTLGSTTGKNGNYLIRSIPPGIYELIVSHISYEFQTVQIKLFTADTLTCNFSLKQRTITGEEVSVTATIPYDWQKDLQKFTELFIGNTKNAKNCDILNPEVINFKNTDSGSFIALTDSVIHVENRSLGYRVDIILKYFKYEENSKNLEFVVYPKYETLKPKNDLELENWFKHRNETYIGSLRHFMKSLAGKKLEENGFLLTYTGRPGKLGIILFDTATDKLIKPTSPGMSYFCFDEIINVFHKNKGHSWIKVENVQTTVDFAGNYYPSDGIKTWGVWSEERIADLLPFNYDSGTYNPVSNVPFYSKATPAIDSLELFLASKSFSKIQGSLIGDVLDELVFKNFDHEEIIKQLHVDIVDIMGDEEAEKWRSLETNKEKAKFLRRFWLLRDMSFETKKNERLQEHYNRLQTARTVYSALTPARYDERGRIFVKYGQPEAKQVDVMPLYKSIDNQEAEIKMAPGRSMETWIYLMSGKQVIYNFVDKGWGYSIVYTLEDIIPKILSEGSEIILGEILRTRADLNVRFAAVYSQYLAAKLGEGGGDILTEIQQEFREILREQATEQQKIPIAVSSQYYDISELQFSLKPALFENEGNEHTLALAYGLREDNVKLLKPDDEDQLKITIQTVIRDPNLNNITINEDTLPLRTIKFDENQELIHQVQFPLHENIFYILANVSNPTGKQKGFKNYSIRTPVYTNQKLSLSSVIFAKKIQPVTEANKAATSQFLLRKNLAIKMYPFSELWTNVPIFIYFEIYGLQQNDTGDTKYEIEYTVAPVKKNGFLDFVAKLNPFKDDKGKISISYSQEGKEVNDYFSIRLDFSQLNMGNYELVVRVKDKIANASKETRTSFLLN